MNYYMTPRFVGGGCCAADPCRGIIEPGHHCKGYAQSGHPEQQSASLSWATQVTESQAECLCSCALNGCILQEDAVRESRCYPPV